MTIGEKVRYIAKIKSIRILDIADKVGYTRQGLYNLMNNKRTINVELLEKISEALEVEPEVFFKKNKKDILDVCHKKAEPDIDVSKIAAKIIAKAANAFVLTLFNSIREIERISYNPADDENKKSADVYNEFKDIDDDSDIDIDNLKLESAKRCPICGGVNDTRKKYCAVCYDNHCIICEAPFQHKGKNFYCKECWRLIKKKQAHKRKFKDVKPGEPWSGVLRPDENI